MCVGVRERVTHQFLPFRRYIPSDLGYGDRGALPDIKGGDALVFVMEIIKILGAKTPAGGADQGQGAFGRAEGREGQLGGSSNPWSLSAIAKSLSL